MISWKKILILVGLVLFLAAPVLAEERREIRPMSIVGSYWPPFQHVQYGKPAGLSTETVSLVLDIMDQPHKIEFFPWKRCVKLYESGEADGVYCISRQEKRMPFLLYAETPLMTSTYMFFIRAEDSGRLVFNSYKDLAKYKVGVTAGYSYSPQLWEELKKMENWEETTTDEQNFRKLIRGRIDYFPCDIYVGYYLLKKLGETLNVTTISRPIFKKDYFFALSKNSKMPDKERFLQDFDSALSEFKKTREYNSIIAKYLR